MNTQKKVTVKNNKKTVGVHKRASQKARIKIGKPTGNNSKNNK